MIAALAARYAEYDAAVSEIVFSTLQRAGFSEMRAGNANPVIGSLPFVSSPTPMITAVLGYLTIVAFGLSVLKLRGKRPAQAEDPLWLRFFVQVHNLILIALSAGMAGSAVYWAVQGRYNFWGNAFKASEKEMALTIYVFYMSKFYEFFDTFIMLLKGKSEQVSLLHVYHHGSISSIWWVIAYAAPGGDAYYSCALNSLVHVLMYTYYALSTMLGKDPARRRKYLWWSRYLTQFQMFQFVTNMAQAAFTYYRSPYPKFLSKLLFFYMITLLALFFNFYRRKHIGGSKAPRKKTQ